MGESHIVYLSDILKACQHPLSYLWFTEKKKILIHDIFNAVQNWRVYWFFVLAELGIPLWVGGRMSLAGPASWYFCPHGVPFTLTMGLGTWLVLTNRTLASEIKQSLYKHLNHWPCPLGRLFFGNQLTCCKGSLWTIWIVISQAGRGPWGWGHLRNFSSSHGPGRKCCLGDLSSSCGVEDKPRRMAQLRAVDPQMVINNKSLSLSAIKFVRWFVVQL